MNHKCTEEDAAGVIKQSNIAKYINMWWFMKGIICSEKSQKIINNETSHYIIEFLLKTQEGKKYTSHMR